MTRPRRPKLEKVTIHLTAGGAAFVRKWAATLGISVGEFVRRILWEVEQKYSRLEDDQDQGGRR